MKQCRNKDIILIGRHIKVDPVNVLLRVILLVFALFCSIFCSMSVFASTGKSKTSSGKKTRFVSASENIILSDDKTTDKETSNKQTSVNKTSENKTSENRASTKTVSNNKVSENKVTKVSKEISEEDVWKLILVNKQNPIPDDYEANMVYFGDGASIREEVVEPLNRMFEVAREDGVSLMVCSGYRSHEYQQSLFDKKIRNYTGKGMSYLDAFRIGSYSVIIPGTSEHELGMAADIVTPTYMVLNEGFANTEAGRWLKNNADKYGFILRYPKGKEYITGIIFEPWHFRYVGEQAAKEITKRDITLEEYVEEIGLY